MMSDRVSLRKSTLPNAVLFDATNRSYLNASDVESRVNSCKTPPVKSSQPVAEHTRHDNASRVVPASAATAHIAQDQPGTRRNQKALMEEVNSFTLEQGINLRPRKTVELRDGDFLRIESIYKNTITGEAFLRGPKFRRNKLLPMMEKQLNEVCWLVDVNLNDGKSSHILKTHRVPASQVLRIRGLRLSNYIFPQCSFREDGYFNFTDKSPNGKGHKEKAYNVFHLVCRTKYIRYFSNSELMQRRECHQMAIERLHEDEADERYRVDDAALRRQWREPFVPGSAGGYTIDEDRIIRMLEEDLGLVNTDASNHEQTNMIEEIVDVDPDPMEGQRRSVKRRNVELESDASSATVDLTSDDNSPPTSTRVACDKKTHVLRYTFGDGYCGGGGSSRGAAMAGLEIRLGVDQDVNCALSYAQNFSDAAINASVDQFCQLRHDDHLVDVLHLSPPCQPYSGAHTWEGKDDEMNTGKYPLKACSATSRVTECLYQRRSSGWDPCYEKLGAASRCLRRPLDYLPQKIHSTLTL